MISTSSVNLQELRHRKGLSLEEIADKTKISTRFLRAIEAEEFDKLPGGLFDTSYIRQYARAIEAEEEDVLRRYASFLAACKHQQACREAEVKKTRTIWGCRWISWLRNLPPATRASHNA